MTIYKNGIITRFINFLKKFNKYTDHISHVKKANGFDVFNFHPSILSNIRALGYEVPTPIQNQSIPPILCGKDIMGLAQTGTGKTAAFALPIINRLMKGERFCARALIVAPTRELAQQIHDSFKQLCRGTDLRCVALYGGVNIAPQIANLEAGFEIVVACPGRLLDHIKQHTIQLSKIETLVLDEADQLLDMGFLPSIRKLLGSLPKNRQTLLFSATMPYAIDELAYEVLRDPIIIKLGNSAPATSVKQMLFPIAAHLKSTLLFKLLRKTKMDSVLIFTRTKYGAENVSRKLVQAGFHAASLQGNLSQSKRQSAIVEFREGKIQILVATDIASRGIDISRISHVINYDMPSTVEAYIHRIGRTGRADKIGEAFTFITQEDDIGVRDIERLLGNKLNQYTFDEFDRVCSV